MTRRREESPLAAFVDQARAIGNGREVWIRALGPESRLLLEDCALLVNDGCVVGLRTRWARRVAVPIVMAWQHITKVHCQRGTPTADDVLHTQNIIAQCEDDVLRESCLRWLCQRYTGGPNGTTHVVDVELA